jgi:type IX secretion system PorP/SprF family membrane protein
MDNQYYHNQYMANPALAGINAGFEFNAAFKAQWTNIEGAPVMQSVTGTYGTQNNKAGFGVNFYNEKAGIINRTSLKGTFAFHLPLNDDETVIDFGLSGGIMKESIDLSKVEGDADDVAFADFNRRPTSIDGDFGAAYRSNGLTVQGALPNLKRLLKKDVVRAVADHTIYMGAVSYRIEMGEGTSVEPKVVYRSVENFKDIIDAGVNMNVFSNKVMLSGIYHSTNSLTVGLGVVYNEQFSILGNYTSNTAAMGNNANGQFEIGLKLAIGKTKGFLQ